MAFVNYSNFSLVIEKNGVEIERGDYTGFVLTSSNVERINTTLSNTSSTVSSFTAYQTGGSGDTAWGFYQSALADTSDILKTSGISALLTTPGDVLTYYNKNVGKRYAIHIRFEYWSSGTKLVMLGQTFAGSTTWITRVSIDGTDSFGRDRSIAIGVLRQNYGAFPFYMLTTDKNSPEDRKSECCIWQSQTVSLFLSTNQYNYFFVFSDEWQPPEPPPPPAPDEPYGDDDYNSSTGGDGDHDDTSDTIVESALPSIGASSSGFCTAYVPTIAQIQELAQRLTDPTIYQALGNTVLNISDVVIGLHVLPVAVPKETSTRQVCVNFLGIGLPAGVYIDKATTQFVEVDCGSLNVTEYWGNCVDYNPYTQIGIFLPFCGFYELDTDDVMGKTIAVSYRVDIMSGACLATIKVDGSVLYQYTGDCANQIPVNSVNFDNFLTNAFNMAIATSTGGAGLAAAGAGASNALEGIRSGGESSVAKQLAEENVLSNYQNVKAQTFGHLMGATAGAVISAKGQYKHAGCLAGSPGFLGVRKPYLIIKRPEQIIPGNFGKYHGFPANTGAILGDLSGYTVVDEIRLNIPDATVDEILECEKLLKGGIVI